MRLVEIAGHNIDPGKVTYVGPITKHFTLDEYEFRIVVDGERMHWQFAAKTATRFARGDLLAAIESAQPEMTELEATACCLPWAKHPQDGGIDLLLADDAMVRVESSDQIPLSCPFDCNEEIPNTVPCRLCHVAGERERIRAR